METKALVDECKQRFHIETKITQLEVMSFLDKKAFYALFYRNVATSLADKVMEKLGPAIDKALKELEIETE